MTSFETVCRTKQTKLGLKDPLLGPNCPNDAAKKTLRNYSSIHKHNSLIIVVV